MEPRHRLFTAITLPTELKHELAGLQQGLSDARWSPLANLHLTLTFIGNTDTQSMCIIASALKEVEAPAFTLKLLPPGYWSSHTLWLGVEASEALLKLKGDIDTVLRSVSVKLEDRPYRPHITLARFKHHPEQSVLNDYLACHQHLEGQSFVVSSFSLLQSFTRPQGVEYRTETQYGLQENP